jgi:hypothetical protein
MPATIIARTDDAFTIQLEIPYRASMLEFEEVIQQRLNEAGVLATTEALQQFDADGSPIQVGDFWHAAEYLSDAANVLFARDSEAKKPWLNAACHRLKHEPGAARQLIRDLRRLAAEKGAPLDHPDIEAAMTYFTNQSRAGRMD